MICIMCKPENQEKESKEFTTFKRNPALKERKGHVVVCKKCCSDFVSERGNTKQALKQLCQIIDMPYIESFADSALKCYKDKISKTKKGIVSMHQNNIYACYVRYIGVMNPNYISFMYSDGVRDEAIDAKINQLEDLKESMIDKDEVVKQEKIKSNFKYLTKIFSQEIIDDIETLSEAVRLKFNEYDLYKNNTNIRQKKYQLKVHIKDLIDLGCLDKKSFLYLYDDEEDDLSEDDNRKVYSEEWRGYYTQKDLEYLQDYYQDLYNDFKLVTRNHRDYARKIAKSSLAMDRAYDDMINGVVGAEKRYKELRETFDTLCKSAQFAENTRGQNDVSLGCYGKVFEKVENKHWIPEWISLEKDDIDTLLDQFGNIKKSL